MGLKMKKFSMIEVHWKIRLWGGGGGGGGGGGHEKPIGGIA